jgi:lysophospholipase L1-like esterase
MAAPTIRRILLVRLLTATVAVLAVLAAGLGALAYLAFLRPPQTSPAEFLARPPAERAAQVVVAAGSSTTRATLSADWVGAVRARAGADTEIVNAGVNGDTAAGLLARLDDDVIATAPAAVVVLIGGNDLRAGVPVTE